MAELVWSPAASRATACGRHEAWEGGLAGLPGRGQVERDRRVCWHVSSSDGPQRQSPRPADAVAPRTAGSRAMHCPSPAARPPLDLVSWASRRNHMLRVTQGCCMCCSWQQTAGPSHANSLRSGCMRAAAQQAGRAAP